jgi:hypothetical protein
MKIIEKIKKYFHKSEWYYIKVELPTKISIESALGSVNKKPHYNDIGLEIDYFTTRIDFKTGQMQINYLKNHIMEKYIYKTENFWEDIDYIEQVYLMKVYGTDIYVKDKIQNIKKRIRRKAKLNKVLKKL